MPVFSYLAWVPAGGLGCLDWPRPVVDIADGILADEPPVLVRPDFLDPLPPVFVVRLGDEADAASRPRLISELDDLLTRGRWCHGVGGSRGALRRGATGLGALSTAVRVLRRHSFTGHAQHVPSTQPRGVQTDPPTLAPDQAVNYTTLLRSLYTRLAR
jgi:hypothetical protein